MEIERENRKTTKALSKAFFFFLAFTKYTTHINNKHKNTGEKGRKGIPQEKQVFFS